MFGLRKKASLPKRIFSTLLPFTPLFLIIGSFYVIVTSFGQMNWVHQHDVPFMFKAFVAAIVILATGQYMSDELREKSKGKK